MYFLYKITNVINGKVYIGQSIKEKERWRQHRYFGKNPEKTGQYIHSAMFKYGIDNFNYEVIAWCKNQEDADFTETQLIEQYSSRNPEKGYNIAPGGVAVWNKGIKTGIQPRLGILHTEISKQKMSESHTGKILTEEHKKKISEGNLGKSVSGEAKEKMRVGNLGKKRSETTKHRMSEAFRKRVGENNSKTSFSREEVLEIRRIYKDEKISQAKLAKMYDVAQSTIWSVLNNKY